MGSTRALAECFKVMVRILSPPIDLEGLMEMRAEKVSSIEIDKEQRAFSGIGKFDRSGN